MFCKQRVGFPTNIDFYICKFDKDIMGAMSTVNVYPPTMLTYIYWWRWTEIGTTSRKELEYYLGLHILMPAT